MLFLTLLNLGNARGWQLKELGRNSATSCSRPGSSNIQEPAPTPGGGSKYRSLAARCHRVRSRVDQLIGSVARRRSGECLKTGCSRPRANISTAWGCSRLARNYRSSATHAKPQEPIQRGERRGWGGTTGVPSSSLAAHFHLTVGNDLTTDLYFSLMMSRRPRFRYRISNLARPGILTTT